MEAGADVEVAAEDDGVTLVEALGDVLDGAVLDTVDDAVDVGEGSGVGETGASVEDAVDVPDVGVGDGSAPARLIPDTESVTVAAITDIRMVVRFIEFSP